MQRRVVLVIASLAALVAAAACDLNPQPLPPADGNERAVDNPGGGSSSGGFGGGEATSDEPSPPAAMIDGGVNGNDGDGGDAGDAATDGSADASDSG